MKLIKALWTDILALFNRNMQGQYDLTITDLYALKRDTRDYNYYDDTPLDQRKLKITYFED